MIRKHFKKSMILLLFFLLVGGFGIKHAVSKGKPGTPAWIGMTVHGDITSGMEVYRCIWITDKTNGLVMGPMDIDLTPYFLGVKFNKMKDGGPSGADCFSERTYYSNALSVGKYRDGTAHARFDFYSYGTDEPLDLHYKLWMYGTFDGTWPPLNGFPTYVHFTEWQLLTSGKGGKLQKISCTGSGTFDTGVTIVVTRDDNNCSN